MLSIKNALKLTHIHVSSIFENDKDNLENLIKIIEECYNLEVFCGNYTEFCLLTDEELLKPFFGKNSLREFSLKNCQMKIENEAFLKKFFDGKDKLEEFDISGNEIKIQCLITIFQELKNKKFLNRVGLSILDLELIEHYQLTSKAGVSNSK